MVVENKHCVEQLSVGGVFSYLIFFIHRLYREQWHDQVFNVFYKVVNYVIRSLGIHNLFCSSQGWMYWKIILRNGVALMNLVQFTIQYHGIMDQMDLMYIFHVDLL